MKWLTVNEKRRNGLWRRQNVRFEWPSTSKRIVHVYTHMRATFPAHWQHTLPSLLASHSLDHGSTLCSPSCWYNSKVKSRHMNETVKRGSFVLLVVVDDANTRRVAAERRARARWHFCWRSTASSLTTRDGTTRWYHNNTSVLPVEKQQHDDDWYFPSMHSIVVVHDALWQGLFDVVVVAGPYSTIVLYCGIVL